MTIKIQPILNQNKFSTIIPSSTQQLESFYFNEANNIEKNKPINDKILTINNSCCVTSVNKQVPTIQINPYIFSKEINLAKKTYSISSTKFNSSVTNKAQNLDKLTITNTDNKNSNKIIKKLLTSSEDNIKTYIDELTNQDCIKVVNYLFYSNNKNLPNLFSYVYNSDIKKCNTLLIICQILKERLKDLKINKHNTIRQTQENFEGYFRNMLAIANIMIQKHIDLLNTQDEKLNDVLNVVTQRIENLQIAMSGLGARHDNNNLGIEENTKNSQLQRVALNSNKQDRYVEDIVSNNFGHNIVINATPLEGQILTQHLEHPKVLPSLSGVNDGVLALNALNLMMRTDNLTSRPICAEHLLKLEKNNLLIILSRFYNKKSTFEKEQVKYFNKFLNIKRGNVLDQIKSKITTTSEKIHAKMIKQAGLVYANSIAINQPSVTFITLRDKIINNLKTNRFDELDAIIEKNKSNKNLLQNLLIKHDGYHGNLFFFLTRAYSKNKNQQSLRNVLYKMLEISQSHPTVKTIAEYNDNDKETAFSSILHYLTTKMILINKFDVLLDIQHIIIGIYLNINLKSSEKNFLIGILNAEGNLESRGLFANLRVKRKLFYQNLAIIEMGMASYGFKKDVQGVTNNSSNSLINGVAGGIGYYGYSIMNPAITYFRIGNTTSFKSLKRILNLSNICNDICISHIKKNKSNSDESMQTADSTNFQENKEVCITKVEKILGTIQQCIKNKDFTSIMDCISDNSELTPYEKYYIFTRKFSDSMLISILYNKIQDENKFKDLLVHIKGVMCNPEDYKDINLIKFKQQIAHMPTSADGCLLHFYKLRAIAEHNSKLDEKEEMIQVLLESVNRSLNDITSKWYNIRKHSPKHDLVVNTAIRSISNFAYGLGTSAIGSMWASGGLTAPLAVPLLILCGLTRFCTQATTEYFTYGETIQAKHISAALKRAALKREYKSTTKLNIYNEHMDKIIESSISGFDEVGKLKVNDEYLNIYFKSLETNYPDDMKHITDINKIYEIYHVYKILENDTGKAVAQHLDKIMNNLSLEVFDKYTANTFFFRLVRIIKLSALDTQIKLRLLNSLFYILHTRLTLSTQTISTERSYITKKNYGIDSLIYSTITPIFQIPYLSGVYAFLTCYGSDVIGDMTSTLVSVAINDSKSHKNTASFQKCSTYIKYAILDEVSDYSKQLNTSHPELLVQIQKIMEIHSGREITQIQSTKTAKYFTETVLSQS